MQNNNQYYWREVPEFELETTDGNPTEVALANFFVRAHHFGYAVNDITALAAIPQVFYLSPGSLTLETQYENAPSAGSYDWSAFPPESINGTLALRDEPVTGGAAQGKVAVGINRESDKR